MSQVVFNLRRTPIEQVASSFLTTIVIFAGCIVAASFLPSDRKDAVVPPVAAIIAPVQEVVEEPIDTINDTELFITRKIQKINPDIDATWLANIIVEESKRQKVSPITVASLINAESTFNHKARSKTGALGLMQLLPTTAEFISKKSGHKWKGADALHNPNYNIRLGIAYLKYLQKFFKGDMSLALSAYNWGPGNVLKSIKTRTSIVAGTMQYTKKILTTSARWQREFEQPVELA